MQAAQSSIETFIRLQNLHIAQQITKQLQSRGYNNTQYGLQLIKICQSSQSQQQFVSKAADYIGTSISQHFLSSLYNTIRQKMVKRQILQRNLNNLNQSQQQDNIKHKQKRYQNQQSNQKEQFQQQSQNQLKNQRERYQSYKSKAFPGLSIPNKDQIQLDLDMYQQQQANNKIQMIDQKKQEQRLKAQQSSFYQKRQNKSWKNKQKFDNKKQQKFRQRSRDKKQQKQRRNQYSSDSQQNHKKKKKDKHHDKEKSHKKQHKQKNKKRQHSRSNQRKEKKKDKHHKIDRLQIQQQQLQITKDIETGKIYKGIITRVEKIGCFVRLQNVNQKSLGLVHASQVREQKVEDLNSIVKQGQNVYVKVLEILQTRIRLSMKNINQRTGKQYLKHIEKQEPKNFLMEVQPPLTKRRHQQSAGQLTGIKIDDNEQGGQANKQSQNNSYAQQWQLSRLKYMPGLVKSNVVVKQDIQQINIQMNDRQPPFLTGQTTKAGINLSPVRVVKNPQGTLQRSALNAVQYAKQRRQVRQQRNKQQVRDLGQILEQVGPTSNRQSIKASLGSKPKSSKMTINDQKTSLPIHAYKQQLVKACCDNKVLIVIGQTGSGKTTQITQYLHQQGFSKKGKIGCTQPRRVAAMSVAKRVSQQMGVKLGQQVGYSIRFQDCTSSKTLIKYMTDGMLLRQALIDKYLTNYSVIMLDQAHQRTIHTDVLFGILKKVIEKRNDFLLIVTSATLQAKKFSSYFFDCKIFSIPGRTYNVQIFYSKEPQTDYLDASLMCVMQIHLDQPPGDILMFLTGQQQIDTACQVLNEKIKKLGPQIPQLIILPVYSALPSQLQTRIFEPAQKGKRKCVIATNIAEASLTIDGIYYVVDPGFAKIKIYNSKLGMDTLIVAPISQASAKQRAGRAGRTGPGKCYRIYTQQAYKTQMLPTSVPQIQRANLANTVLQLKAMGINDLINFDFMDPPPVQTLIAALQQLYYLSALDQQGLLTKLGRKMAQFPLEPSLSKMLLTSIDFQCSQQIITIISMLSVQNIFYRPKQKQTVADQKKTKFNHFQGDHLTYLSVFDAWKKQNYSSQWCHQNYVQNRSLRRAQDVKKQIEQLLSRYKFKITSCNGNYSLIRKTIVSGFFFHAAKKDPKGGYRTLVDDHQVYIHPSSSLFNKQPQWVVYHQLIFTTKQYMRDVCAINPKWLIDVAPNFFKFTDQISFTRKKRNQKLEPLNQKHGDNNAWRLSKRKG